MMYEGLPKLPGNTFKDPTQTKFHLSQSLGYKNGYALASRPLVGIGGRAINVPSLDEQQLDELANYKPTLTYGQAKQAPPEDFVPAHVAFDKKVLQFTGYFKQTVHESNQEFYRVRPVKIHYYLEDDSISVLEPHVVNSGIPQGMLIKRQRLPKNDIGDHWHWKDINLGMDVSFYGKNFHICDVDEFTKNFLESEGIIVNPPEPMAVDPYIAKRQKAEALKTYNTPSSFDQLKQFIELDRKVLRFFCVWDDRHAMFGELNPLILHYYLVDDTIELREYYLVDDTIELREVRVNNDGHDPFPVLIGRAKAPIDRYDVPSSFPTISMELTDHEIKEYFNPKHLMVGKTIHIFGRRVLLYDCDNFTKSFYYHNFGITEFTPVDVNVKEVPLEKMEIPPYNNLGSLEDSIQSCLAVVPKPPKKDYVKLMENQNKVLRFEAELDSVKPEDKDRRFIISYQLCDDMIKIYEPHQRNSGIIGGPFLEGVDRYEIYEPHQRNSGIIGGPFLEGTRVAKPNCNPNQPEYYGPSDFYIGAMVTIFRHRFRIVNADEYVMRYMEQNSEKFPEHTIASIRQAVTDTAQPTNILDRKGAPMSVNRKPGDLDTPVTQVALQLKKLAITDKIRIDGMFLKPGDLDTLVTQVALQLKKLAITDKIRIDGMFLKPGDLDTLVTQVALQLKKLAITDKIRIDGMFLKYNRDHGGFVGRFDLRNMCHKLQLPVDDDVILGLMARISPANPEKISLEHFRNFLEN